MTASETERGFASCLRIKRSVYWNAGSGAEGADLNPQCPSSLGWDKGPLGICQSIPTTGLRNPCTAPWALITATNESQEGSLAWSQADSPLCLVSFITAVFRRGIYILMKQHSYHYFSEIAKIGSCGSRHTYAWVIILELQWGLVGNAIKFLRLFTSSAIKPTSLWSMVDQSARKACSDTK